MMSSKDLFLMDHDKIENLNIGLKAKNLIRIANNNFFDHIPPFFIVLPDLCDSIKENEEINPEIRDSIRKAALKLNSKYFFVRTNAVKEDMIGYPTAGLFLTEGKVKLNELADSILNCILFSKEKKIYKILGFYPSISIIVQKMIIPMYSGVLFTKNPVSNEETKILIEAGYGLGNTIVSGSYHTDYYEIDKESPKESVYSKISKKNYFFSPFTNSKHEVPENLKKKPVLSDLDLAKLVDFAINLEKVYNVPINLEWSIDFKGNLWFLQIRDAQ